LHSGQRYLHHHDNAHTVLVTYNGTELVLWKVVMRTKGSESIRHFEGNDHLESTNVTRLHANHTIDLSHLRIRVVHVAASKVTEIICRIYWHLWIVTDGGVMSPMIREFSSGGTWY
jgi:hypothetical protein